MCYRNEAIETIEKDGFKLEIFQDDSPDSPENWGWPIKVIRPRRSFGGMDGREIISEYGNVWYSEILTRDGYHYVIASKEDWIKAMKQGAEKAAKHGWPTTKADMQKMVDAMAETMQQYFDGDVYGYRVSLIATDEEKGSVWGFYGMGHVMEEGKAALDFAVKTEQDAIAFERQSMAL